MTVNLVKPDPRTQRPEICRVTYVGGSGLEWVCIRPVHAPAYRRRSTDRTHQGEVSGTGAHPERFGPVSAAPADRHWFINRWPNREARDD
jgi:hypothetical protein